MTKIFWKKYKKYSGLQINGNTAVERLTKYKYNHMYRAFYLTVQLEAPQWGSVQSYDGAGISGGPFHYTAYSPGSKKQGSLFSLLRAIELGLGTQQNKNLETLYTAFKKQNWFVARDGYLRRFNDGELIFGAEIRDTFAPPDGTVPEAGKHRVQAEYWAMLFHNLLGDSTTFHAQTEHAIEYLIHGQKSLEYKAYEKLTLGEIDITTPEVLTVLSGNAADRSKLTLEEDLAMCVYHSYSVNAPGPARKCLQEAICDPNNISRKLIHLLGTSNYGRWHDTEDGKNRYDRTRKAAIHLGLWPAWYFYDDGIMPENIKEE